MKIRDMDDNHLLNAYRMMVEKGFIGKETLYFYLNCTPPSGDMAQYAFDQELDQVLSAPCHPAVDWLEDEIKRRKLTAKTPRSYEP